MYSFKISKRYRSMFQVELSFSSVTQGSVVAWCIGSNPLVFRTDASARNVAKMLVDDCKLEKANKLLIVDGIKFVVGSKNTLMEIIRYWGDQLILDELQVEIVNAECTPDKELNPKYLKKVRNQFLPETSRVN